MRHSLTFLILFGCSTSVYSQISNPNSRQISPIRVHIGYIDLDPTDSSDYLMIDPCESCIDFEGGLDQLRNEFVKSIKSNPLFVDEPFNCVVTFELGPSGISEISVFPPDSVNSENSELIQRVLETLRLNRDNLSAYSLVVKNRKESTFSIVEEPAGFPGGREAFFQYLAQNMQYPELARRKGVQGRVFVQFVVEKDGAISNAKVVKGIGAGCDEEALRVIASSPKWIPGRHRGKVIRQNMVQSIVFKFIEIKKKKRKKG